MMIILLAPGEKHQTFTLCNPLSDIELLNLVWQSGLVGRKFLKLTSKAMVISKIGATYYIMTTSEVLRHG